LLGGGGGEVGMPFVVRYIEQHQSWVVIWSFKTNSLVSVISKPLSKNKKQKKNYLANTCWIYWGTMIV
jgi:hypothetical protein